MRVYALIPILLAAQSAIAAPIDDPWALVPELPNTCYSEQDDFDARSHAARETVEAEKAQQDEINSAISQQSKDLDPTEMQQRTMQYLMEHPEDAEKLMRGMMQTMQEANEAAPEVIAQRQQQEDEFNELVARYDAAYQEALGPLEAHWDKGIGMGDPGDLLGEEELLALVEKMNAAYGGLCQTWWKNGPFHAWLAKEKAFLIEDAAAREEGDEAGVEQNALMLGVNADGYRSTASLSAARDYLQRATAIFSKRQVVPRKYSSI